MDKYGIYALAGRKGKPTRASPFFLGLERRMRRTDYLPITAAGVNHIWQCDLLDLQRYKSQNKGIRFLLVVIDVYSRMLWVEPLSGKFAAKTTEAMKAILKRANGWPANLNLDAGREFLSSFSKLMKRGDTVLWVSDPETSNKNAIAERVNRTIRNMLGRWFNITGKHAYLGILQELVDAYNNSIHSTINSKPINVYRGGKRKPDRTATEDKIPIGTWVRTEVKRDRH